MTTLARPEPLRQLSDRQGGQNAADPQPRLLTWITLVTGILTAGALLSVIYLWVGFHREFRPVETAPGVETEIESPSMSELHTGAPPVGGRFTF